ncbi:MAG: hypothetical protein HFG00_11820 [Oscillibacter sp.]|nr:hypothetical protein [Oscillibacter sp.]
MKTSNIFVKGAEISKCISMIGSAGSNGVIKTIFLQSFEHENAGLDVKAICFLAFAAIRNEILSLSRAKTRDIAASEGYFPQ